MTAPYLNNSQFTLSNFSNVIGSIREIVGFTNAQYPHDSQIREREAAINRRIYRYVNEVLNRNHGLLDLNRAHEKYYQAISRAFADHPNEIQIFACRHLGHSTNTENSFTGLMEPFYIESTRRGLQLNKR